MTSLNFNQFPCQFVEFKFIYENKKELNYLSMEKHRFLLILRDNLCVIFFFVKK